MGEKAKEDVQQGGVVGLEGGSWVAEKNGGNLRVAAVGSGRIFAEPGEFSFPNEHCPYTDTPLNFVQLSIPGYASECVRPSMTRQP